MSWHFTWELVVNDEMVDAEIVFDHDSESGFYATEVMVTFDSGVSEQLDLKLTSKELDKEIQDLIDNWAFLHRNELGDDDDGY